MGGEGETVTNISQLSGLKLEKKMRGQFFFLHVIVDGFTGRVSKAIF